jgi:hypothetical protein
MLKYWVTVKTFPTGLTCIYLCLIINSDLGPELNNTDEVLQGTGWLRQRPEWVAKGGRDHFIASGLTT